MTLRLSRRLTLAAAALPLLVTGCAGGSPDTGGGAGTEGDFNDADVAFATEMIQHHAQALTMVDLTLGRDLQPETGELMEEIRAAQAPEIEQMVDLLQEWDQPVPETVRDHANAHGGQGDDAGSDGDAGDGGHDGMASMPGMMSEAQMAELADASPAAFEDLLLTLMIEHHEGAVVMAEEELAEGVNPEARALARDIVETQTAEIATMERLLADELPAD